MRAAKIRRPPIWPLIWAIILLFSAGTLRWLYGWIYIIEIFCAELLFRYLLHRNAPDIAAERSRAYLQKDQTPADRIVQLVGIVTYICLFIITGLDQRLGWSEVPVWVRLVGAAFVFITSYSTYRVAMENKFAVLVVKIQHNRGHRVVDTGPYRFVRHPMYAGLAFGIIGTPLLLGSWWGLCVAPVAIILLITRVLVEERALTTGLDGYEAYALRVRYRLIPLVW